MLFLAVPFFQIESSNKRDIPEKSLPELGRDFILGTGLARRRVPNPERVLGETVRKLNSLRANDSDQAAINGAYDLYTSAKITAVLPKQEKAKQEYCDLMAVYISSNVADALKRERYQLTEDELQDYELVLKSLLKDYAHDYRHHDEVLKGDIFSMIYQNLRSMKSKFGVELGKPLNSTASKTPEPQAIPQ